MWPFVDPGTPAANVALTQAPATAAGPSASSLLVAAVASPATSESSAGLASSIVVTGVTGTGLPDLGAASSLSGPQSTNTGPAVSDPLVDPLLASDPFGHEVSAKPPAAGAELSPANPPSAVSADSGAISAGSSASTAALVSGNGGEAGSAGDLGAAVSVAPAGGQDGSGSPVQRNSRNHGGEPLHNVATVSNLVPDPGCACSGSELIQAAPGSVPDIPSTFSEAGVRYYDGTVRVKMSQLASSGFSLPWGQSPSFTNLLNFPIKNFNGNGIVDLQLPYVVQGTPGSNNQIIAISSGATARYFNYVSGAYQPSFFDTDQLSYDSANNQFIVTTTTGDRLSFYDFTVTPTIKRGQFKQVIDEYGNYSTNSYDTTPTDANYGKITDVQLFSQAGSQIDDYAYTYLASPDPNAGMLATVTLQRAGTPIRQVVYAYYVNTDNNGNLADLKTAIVKDGSGNVLDTEYMRYWKTTGGSGYADGLKAYFDPASYARLVAAEGTSLDSLADSVVDPYAYRYFEYDPSSQYVTKAVVQGAGSSTSTTPGQGTYGYSFTYSSFSTDYNNWDTKVVETLPDNSPGNLLSQKITYTNGYGEVMLQVVQYQPNGQGLQQWETFYHYDSAGRVDRTVHQSAITTGSVGVYQGYNDTFADLMDQNTVGDYYWLSTSAGLVDITDYDTSVSPHYVSAHKVHQGWIYPAETNAITLDAIQYTSHQADASYGGGTVYPVSSRTVYRNTDGTGGEQTSYAYTWYNLSNKATNRMQSETVTLPQVSTGQNGPGTNATQVSNFDTFGRTTSFTDADGYVKNTTFDSATGATTQEAVDVNGLNLVTSWVVDSLGRATKETDPSDANTAANVTYTVYNDVNHEVLTYPGWQTSTNTPTGPTQVWREDRSSSPSYTETFTMTATPAVSGGKPTGGETVGYIQSMVRTFTSDGGQVTETDTYNGLGGTSYSTASAIPGASYDAVLYDYDTRGHQNRVKSPVAGQSSTNTIHRTVYDGLGRPVSAWVGTNDTPASGTWSPSNNTSPSNMVQTSGNVYDGGGAGDSTLTQVTQYPNDGSANRVNQFYFDWRDRKWAEKDGVMPTLGQENDSAHRPIFYTQLDNLGQVSPFQKCLPF
jgi:hypothetical protein